MINKWKVNPKLTKSFTYILPIFNEELKLRYIKNIVGSYLYSDAEEMSFSILYEFSGKEGFTKYEDVLTSSPLFIGHEDYGEYVLYKFKTNDDIAKAIVLFEKGAYSKFKEEHKEAIVSFIRSMGGNQYKKVRMILWKDRELRMEMEEELQVQIGPDSELSSPPDLSAELFTQYIEEIKINNEDAF